MAHNVRSVMQEWLGARCQARICSISTTSKPGQLAQGACHIPTVARAKTSSGITFRSDSRVMMSEMHDSSRHVRRCRAELNVPSPVKAVAVTMSHYEALVLDSRRLFVVWPVERRFGCTGGCVLLRRCVRDSQDVLPGTSRVPQPEASAPRGFASGKPVARETAGTVRIPSRCKYKRTNSNAGSISRCTDLSPPSSCSIMLATTFTSPHAARNSSESSGANAAKWQQQN